MHKKLYTGKYTYPAFLQIKKNLQNETWLNFVIFLAEDNEIVILYDIPSEPIEDFEDDECQSDEIEDVKKNYEKELKEFLKKIDTQADREENRPLSVLGQQVKNQIKDEFTYCSDVFTFDGKEIRTTDDFFELCFSIDERIEKDANRLLEEIESLKEKREKMTQEGTYDK